MGLGGPLACLVLSAFFLLLSLALHPFAGVVFGIAFKWLGVVNAILAAFNLLPGFPLDGGRVLRAGIWKWTGSLGDATRIASTFGQGIGILMIVGGVLMFFTSGSFGNLWLAFIGWYLMQAAQSSYQQMVLREALTGVPVSRVMTAEVDVVAPDITLDEVVHDYIMARNHPAFPVVENGRAMGLLCINEVRGVPRESWAAVTARQVAQPLSEANAIAPSADAWEALIRMSQGDCGRLLVVESGALLGIISRTDIMRLMRSRLRLGL